MLEVLKKTANKTYTENGAVAHRTSGKDCLDLFAAIGALRRADDQNICSRFLKAYAENPDLAMKILFYARDVRGGLGERRVFRSILAWLASNEKSSVVRNLPYIAEYGRWDDVLVLLNPAARKLWPCLKSSSGRILPRWKPAATFPCLASGSPRSTHPIRKQSSWLR